MENSEVDLALITTLTQSFRYMKVNPQIVEVRYQPFKNSIKKQCYNNSFRYLTQEHGNDVRYIMGYLFLYKTIPIDHAFVRVGTEYLEITVKPGPDDIHVSLVEITRQELLDYVVDNNHAPDLFSYNRWLAERARKSKDYKS